MIRKKGISPLLAAVLLIAVTVSIGTLVMGWLGTIMRSTQTEVSNTTTEAVDCSSAGIIIEDVFLSSGFNKTARVIARNSGFLDGMQIISAQIYNRTGSNFSASSLPVTNLNKGNLTTLSFSPNATIVNACPDDFSRVIVSTNCGSTEFTAVPSCF
jgi:flagellin-like protein